MATNQICLLRMGRDMLQKMRKEKQKVVFCQTNGEMMIRKKQTDHTGLLTVKNHPMVYWQVAESKMIRKKTTGTTMLHRSLQGIGWACLLVLEPLLLEEMIHIIFLMMIIYTTRS
uniref:Uncharacterized protein n=1 Tax=Opuntia streptacantha TaxID=393608 RepID=A0A7C9F6V0_OPUST